MAKSGKFWREHHSPALIVGKKELKKFTEHYAKEGVSVDFRPTECGDYEPVIHSREHFNAMLRARGLVDKG